MNIIQKFNLIPTKIKDYIIVGLIVSIIVLVIIMSINNFNNVKRQIEIEETKSELAETKLQIENYKKALEDNIKAYDSFTQATVEDIKKITNIKPKRIKYEKIKVRDTSYDAMRRVLDTAQPN
jgi:predicted Holliday junction resolvase-like endonuclease